MTFFINIRLSNLGIAAIGIIPGTDLGTGAVHDQDLRSRGAAVHTTETEAGTGIAKTTGKMADPDEMALPISSGFASTHLDMLILRRRDTRHDRGDRGDRDRRRDRNRNRNVSPKKNKFLERAQKLGELNSMLISRSCQSRVPDAVIYQFYLESRFFCRHPNRYSRGGVSSCSEPA